VGLADGRLHAQRELLATEDVHRRGEVELAAPIGRCGDHDLLRVEAARQQDLDVDGLPGDDGDALEAASVTDARELEDLRSGRHGGEGEPAVGVDPGPCTGRDHGDDGVGDRLAVGGHDPTGDRAVLLGEERGGEENEHEEHGARVVTPRRSTRAGYGPRDRAAHRPEYL
jgi:hypothetical protein